MGEEMFRVEVAKERKKADEIFQRVSIILCLNIKHAKPEPHHFDGAVTRCGSFMELQYDAVQVPAPALMFHKKRFL
jgi:hypothetical protein